MKEIFVLILLLLELYIYIKKSNKFKLRKYEYIISVLFSFFIYVFLNDFSLKYIIFVVLLEILMILSFTDLKYYEIDGNSYLFLIIPIIINNLNMINRENIFFVVLSPILIYFIFWIFDKIIGIENLGGADVKIILILSFYFSALYIFSFMIYIFLFSIIIFIIKAIKLKKIKNIQIPMIIPICISFFIHGGFFL